MKLFIILVIAILAALLVITLLNRRAGRPRREMLSNSTESNRIKTWINYARGNMPFEPDLHEIIFYTTVPDTELEKLIADNLEEIRRAMDENHYRFFFLPDFNKGFDIKESADQLTYFNPRQAAPVARPDELLTYPDIKTALSIPDTVDGPCLIHCEWASNDKVANVAIARIDLPEDNDIISILKEFIDNFGFECRYRRVTDEAIRAVLKNLCADDRFDTDILLIGKEIRERIDLLRAKGLSSLAIKKLIGDDCDRPGRLLIDRHYRIILTDYGNMEIKLSPIHKAVFFLFLRHPEGICFKDLGQYKDELRMIYNEVSCRDDTAAIEESIDRLTDPFDNSINEKCARIKNAFVSEFREEIARWYIIDGQKGESKTIRLPRELVTWENKD